MLVKIFVLVCGPSNWICWKRFSRCYCEDWLMLILLSFYTFYFYSWILVRLSPPEICQYHPFLIFLFMYEEKVTFPECLLITVLCVVICSPDWNWDVVLNCFPILKKTKVLFWRIVWRKAQLISCICNEVELLLTSL